MLWLRVSFGILAGTSFAGFFYRPFAIMTSVAAVGLSLLSAAVMGLVLYAGGVPTGNGSFEVDRWWSLSVIIILLAITTLAISVIRK
jgi:steroid 5-alpha reductase family enzyme